MRVIAEENRGRRAERAREDILLAAARAFAQSSVAQATMGDIAREAGYTVPSLYAYFGSKDAIVEGLGAMLTSEIMGVFDEGFPAGLTSGQRVELLLRRLFAMTDRRREILAVFLTLPMAGGTAKEMINGYELMRARMARWFREHERLGARGRRTADQLATALCGLADGFLRRWLMDRQRSLLVHQASFIAEMFMGGAQPQLKAAREKR